MRRPIALVALTLALAAAACTAKEDTPVTPRSKGISQETLEQVRGLQEQIRRYLEESTAALGGASPNPGTVRIGPSPCSSRTSDIAENGVYTMAGGWQIPLAAEEQLPRIRSIRDAWQAKGYEILLYKEIDNTSARLEGKDPANGFTFAIISTEPPTDVAVFADSPCVMPPDRTYPAGVTTYR